MNKIYSLELIRLIGWIGIFICHFRGAMAPGESMFLDYTPLKFIWSGEGYVRLFFVLTGVVVSYKYFVRKNYNTVLADCVKRYFRLMPHILVAEIIVFFLMSSDLLFNAQAANITGSKNFLALFNQFDPNLSMLLKESLYGTFVYGDNGYIGPLWCIKYEFLGTFLVLASLIILKKSKFRWIYYILFLLLFSGYYNYFILGMLISDIYLNTNIVKIVSKYNYLNVIILLIGYYSFSMTPLTVEKTNMDYIFYIGIVIFLIGLLSNNNMNSFSNNKFIIKGGEISYSAYILHWPIIESFSSAFVISFYTYFSYKMLFILNFVITFILVTGISYIFSKYMDNISLKLSNYVANMFIKDGVIDENG